jgi:MazG family protein
MSDDAGREFQRLVEVVAALRAPNGCPWDRDQTLESLRPFVLEETYEVLHAIDTRDLASLREELGDFIFEGVLLAQVTADGGDFTVADSLRAIVDKLVRRHPHVFGSVPRAATPAEALGRWEEVKAREREGKTMPGTILGGLATALPSLLTAYQMAKRAAAVGFDWVRAEDVLAKIDEEIGELRRAVAEKSPVDAWRIEEEMGDVLFAIANLARKLGIEPESALRRANAKFVRRFNELERRFAARGLSLREITLDELEAEWGRIKAAESPD